MIRTRTLAAMGTAILLTSSVVSAQSSNSSTKQLLVTSATVDRTNDTVTLKGSGFGVKKPAVFCELTQMTVLSANDDELLVSFPASVLDGTFLFTVARGNGVTERAAFYVTTSRPQILEGKRGPAGPQGATGAQGPKGDKGDPGDKGDTGDKGDKGDTGAQGVKGDTGAAGPQGAAGPLGPQGVAGPQGAEGAQGAQGAVGPQGPAGPQGVAGPAGPQGTQGPMGFVGPAGPQGVPGISGYERVGGGSGTLQLGAAISSYVLAACPAGKRPIAGGHELVSISAQQLNVTMSAPYDSNTGTGWRVSFRNGTNNSMINVQVRAHVVCAVTQ